MDAGTTEQAGYPVSPLTQTHRETASPRPSRQTHPLGRYDRLARVLHWVFAVSIIYATVVGYTAGHITHTTWRLFLQHLNMSVATVLIVLFPLRLVWRLKRREPPPLPGMSTPQRTLAHAVHGLLYFTIAWVLVSGYLMVPQSYRFFGLLTIPTPFTRGPLTDELFLVHRVGCAVLGALVVVHVLAVVKHQWIARVPVLSRML